MAFSFRVLVYLSQKLLGEVGLASLARKELMVVMVGICAL